METLKIDIEHIKKFVSKSELNKQATAAAAARETLLTHSGKGNDFLGWIDLPARTTTRQTSRIRTEVGRLASISEYVVVVGIGGSYLGARAVIDAFQHRSAFSEGYPYILYAGHTLSEDYYHWLMEILATVDYSVIVISKSGTTTEPAVAFRLLKRDLEKRYGRYGAAQRIVAITDQRRGALHDIALQKGYSSYVIPDNVGGRFSVLTPVGLLPIAMTGLNIDSLLRGARHMRKVCLASDNIDENPALLYAAARNALYQTGRQVEMMVNFAPNLRTFSEWWKQLYGESEGKEGKGLMPHSLSFTTDLHSMGQYVQQGPRSMFETVLSIRQPHHRINIPTDKQDLDGLNYLAGKTLTDINHCAEQGTVLAHEKGGVPVMRIELPKINEETLGQLIYMFEFACGVSGYMLGVNPFDQPGVEAYKNNMFALLGKPGYTL